MNPVPVSTATAVPSCSAILEPSAIWGEPTWVAVIGALGVIAAAWIAFHATAKSIRASFEVAKADRAAQMKRRVFLRAGSALMEEARSFEALSKPPFVAPAISPRALEALFMIHFAASSEAVEALMAASVAYASGVTDLQGRAARILSTPGEPAVAELAAQQPEVARQYLVNFGEALVDFLAAARRELGFGDQSDLDRFREAWRRHIESLRDSIPTRR